MAQWSRRFAGSPVQVAQARRFARMVLTDRPALQSAELVVSELATNALRFSSSGLADGWFVVELTKEPSLIRIAVVDLGGPGEPRVAPFGEDSTEHESGRGLYTVACLVKQWGWEPAGTGRRVWAELSDDPL